MQRCNSCGRRARTLSMKEDRFAPGQVYYECPKDRRIKCITRRERKPFRKQVGVREI